MASSLVKSSKVQEDMSRLKTILNKYDSLINEFNSAWTGQSNNNLKSISSDFKGEYNSTISDQMQNFADACNLYEGYSISNDNYNKATDYYNNTANDSSLDNNIKMTRLNTYSNNQLRFNNEMKSSSGQINAKLSQISKKLDATAKTYSATVDTSSSVQLRIDGSPSENTNSNLFNRDPQSSVEIPSDINQASYTVTCYGEGGWYLGGSSSATAIASGTNQEALHSAWVKDGCRYKDGIAVLNVNGQDCYLIATANTFGNVGDVVNVNFANGQSIPCVIADEKSPGDSNYTRYGHSYGGSTNILEFEVDRNKYLSSGNPTTEGWGLEWDSNSNVTKIDNYGSTI